MKKLLMILCTIMLMTAVTAACGSSGPSDTPAGSGGQTDQSPTNNGTNATPNLDDTAKGQTGNEKKTIVFSTFFPDDFFQEAKKKYEAAHPNITIDLRYIESDDAHGEENLEKFVKTTNTAMLSGNGPDLIEMDKLPIGSYINKQLLANIGDMIDKDPSFKKERYFNNILDGMKQNGGIYGMPLHFFVYGFIGNETAIASSGVKIDDSTWDWSQFAAIAKELVKHTGQKHQYALNGTPEYFLNEMVNDRFATFVDREKGKANFESEAFLDLLRQVKSLFDENIITDKPELALFRRASIVSPADYIREMNQSEFLSDGLAYKSKLYLKPNANGQHGGSYFRTYKTLGINAKSAVKEEAWDFIKFMLSDEMEGRSDSAGFPLNKAVYDKQVRQLLQEGTVKSDQPVGRMKGKEFKITEQDMKALDKFLSGAIYPVEFNPSKIDEMIQEESKAYFSGQKSAEDVAKLIQNRVTTVLNE